ncbi:MAG: hypothetical protein QM725_14275 [Lacibacter sp.]
MISTILAIDDGDEILGEFFADCLADLKNFENERLDITYITSSRLNEASVSMLIPKDKKFVFLAYSHGSDNELLSSGTNPYVSEKVNITLFKNSFFYTCSCYTGKKLGEILIENECLSYIGYKEKFEVWNYNRRPFVECANFGFKLFVQGESVDLVLQKMKEKYDEQIDDYNNDYFGAAHLLANKNALVALGDINLSASDFIETLG